MSGGKTGGGRAVQTQVDAQTYTTWYHLSWFTGGGKEMEGRSKIQMCKLFPPGIVTTSFPSFLFQLYIIYISLCQIKYIFFIIFLTFIVND